MYEAYGIIEEDFASAEIEVVPAYKARDVGFDRSMVVAYGQDDRICAYTSLHAILNIENPKRTAVALITDKEEVGSQGNTGMQSAFFENVIAELVELTMEEPSEIMVKRTMANSRVLSADVNAVSYTHLDVYKRQGAGIGTGGRRLCYETV